MTMKVSVLRENKNRYRIPIRLAEHANKKIAQKTARNVLKRSDLRQELSLALIPSPTTETVSEGTLVSAREILEAVANHGAEQLISKLENSPDQASCLEEPFIIREKALTRQVAQEILKNRNDLRKALGLKLQKKAKGNSVKTKGLTEILVAAQAQVEALQIVQSVANNNARMDALAAVNLLTGPQDRS